MNISFCRKSPLLLHSNNDTTDNPVDNPVDNSQEKIYDKYPHTDYPISYLPMQSISNKVNLTQLENYNYAKNFFERNLNTQKPVMGTVENLNFMLSNERVRRNLCRYFAERAENELAKLQTCNDKDKAQSDKIEGLQQIKNFFKDFLEVWPEEKLSLNSKQVAFSGQLLQEDEDECKKIVHGFAGACSGISAILGSGAAIGADTPIIRTLQGLMFLTMQQKLNVPFIASTEYMLKEIAAGSTIGVEGARIITSWLGIAAHAASNISGASLVGTDALIAGSVSAINGSLSFLITEKMGRGYIKRVKDNKMNFWSQVAETGTYFLARGCFTDHHALNFDFMPNQSVTNACDSDAIMNAFDAMPTETKTLFGEFLNIVKDIGSNKLKVFFVIGIFQNLSTLMNTKIDNLDKAKIVLKQTFKSALFNTSVYEICNLATNETITQNAIDTLNDMQDNLEQYPEVYKVFLEREQAFINKLDLDHLHKEFYHTDFLNHFKNKAFVYDLSNFAKESIHEFSIAYRNRHLKKQKEKITTINDGYTTEGNKANDLESKKDPDIANEADNIIEKFENLTKASQATLPSQKNFGYTHIAGYENIKDKITKTFIGPVIAESSQIKVDIPNAFLFYGPTGTGKSTFTRAICEQSNCKCKELNTLGSAEQIIKDLLLKGEQSRKTFIESGNKTRTVIVVDEFDLLAKDPTLVSAFKDFMEKCSKELHCTLFLTTNKPSDIDPNFLAKSIKIPVGPPEREDIKDILKHYMEDKKTEPLNYDILSEMLIKKSGKSKYSNAQLKAMCEKCSKLAIKEKRSINQNDMIKYIETMQPAISQEKFELFEKAKSKLH